MLGSQSLHFFLHPIHVVCLQHFREQQLAEKLGPNGGKDGWGEEMALLLKTWLLLLQLLLVELLVVELLVLVHVLMVQGYAEMEASSSVLRSCIDMTLDLLTPDVQVLRSLP